MPSIPVAPSNFLKFAATSSGSSLSAASIGTQPTAPLLPAIRSGRATAPHYRWRATNRNRVCPSALPAPEVMRDRRRTRLVLKQEDVPVVVVGLCDLLKALDREFGWLALPRRELLFRCLHLLGSRLERQTKSRPECLQALWVNLDHYPHRAEYTARIRGSSVSEVLSPTVHLTSNAAGLGFDRDLRALSQTCASGQPPRSEGTVEGTKPLPKGFFSALN